MMNKNGHEVGHAPGRSNSLRQVTRHVIWARGAGRCHICNVDLIGDLISGAEDANFGFIAHIVADTPTGPRGDPIRSRKLSDDPDNLMLLCYKHHKAVDVDMVDDYPEAELLGDRAREQSRARIAIQAEILPGNERRMLSATRRMLASTPSLCRIGISLRPFSHFAIRRRGNQPSICFSEEVHLRMANGSTGSPRHLISSASTQGGCEIE